MSTVYTKFIDSTFIHSKRVLFYDPVKQMYLTKIGNELVYMNFYDDSFGFENQQFFIHQDQNDTNISYIQVAERNSNDQQYIGVGNKNMIGYLYTSKNQFTKWHLKFDYWNDKILLQYRGVKLNNSEQCIVVEVKENSQESQKSQLSWLYAYQDIVQIYSLQIIRPYSTYLIQEDEDYQAVVLQYIITNYHQLPNVVAFIQHDSINSHNPTLLHAFDNLHLITQTQPLGFFDNSDNYPNKLLILQNYVQTQYGFKYYLFNQSFSNFSLTNTQTNPNQLSHFHKFQIHFNQTDNMFNELFKYCNYQIVNNNNHSSFYTTVGGIFATTSKNMLKYPKFFYQCLLDVYKAFPQLNYDYNIVLKNLWLLIFNYHPDIYLSPVKN